MSMTIAQELEKLGFSGAGKIIEKYRLENTKPRAYQEEATSFLNDTQVVTFNSFVCGEGRDLESQHLFYFEITPDVGLEHLAKTPSQLDDSIFCLRACVAPVSDVSRLALKRRQSLATLLVHRLLRQSVGEDYVVSVEKLIATWFGVRSKRSIEVS